MFILSIFTLQRSHTGHMVTTSQMWNPAVLDAFQVAVFQRALTVNSASVKLFKCFSCSRVMSLWPTTALWKEEYQMIIKVSIC